jgi:hypothetical protein
VAKGKGERKERGAMWNMKDVYVANERYADIRRTAEKHNAMARLKAKVREEQPSGKRNTKLWERVRKALR